jgi:GR25 family glycosyltransferase involved in LPS biosynthesis
MDKCKDRLELSTQRLAAAGFTNVHRFGAVDAELDDLPNAWKAHGSPRFDPSDSEFVKYKGKQACALGHYNIWKDMIDNNIPVALVFEDDVEFHKDWATLAPAYWASTPRDFDVLYLGSQMDIPVSGHIVVSPVFCTHAYMLTLEGAKKLYHLCVNEPKGTRTIDCMLIDHMKQMYFTRGKYHAFQWYVWNGTLFPDEKAKKREDWAKRNTGLVFQDSDLGTFVRPW